MTSSMGLAGHMPAIHAHSIKALIFGFVRNDDKYVARKHLGIGTVELVTNICRLSLPRVDIARHTVQLLLLLSLCCLYVCVSNK
jgi:hypothetical protein